MGASKASRGRGRRSRGSPLPTVDPDNEPATVQEEGYASRISQCLWWLFGCLVPACLSAAMIVRYIQIQSTPRATPAGPPPQVRVGVWNVYWRALNDPQGQAAIGNALNWAGAFDAFALVEAAGSAESARFPKWVTRSAATFSNNMSFVSTVSKYEHMAIFFREPTWECVWSQGGEFEPGRPFLVALLERRAGGEPLWLVSVHMPHAQDRNPALATPGEMLVKSLAAGEQATGRAVGPLIVLGDFNEYGECSHEDDRCSSEVFRPAMSGMAALWRDQPSLRDVTPFGTTTCCTKWAEQQLDWFHHFDHVFTSFDVADGAAQLINYTYPGIRGECSTPACAGDSPPSGSHFLPSHKPQGSWHRGWELVFRLPSASAHRDAVTTGVVEPHGHTRDIKSWLTG